MTTAIILVLAVGITWLVCRHRYRDDRPCCLPADEYGTGTPIHDALAVETFRGQLADGRWGQ